MKKGIDEAVEEVMSKVKLTDKFTLESVIELLKEIN
jgi:hypothetical protein